MGCLLAATEADGKIIRLGFVTEFRLCNRAGYFGTPRIRTKNGGETLTRRLPAPSKKIDQNLQLAPGGIEPTTPSLCSRHVQEPMRMQGCALTLG